MNVARAWDVFVAEAVQLGGSRSAIEASRVVFEPALRAAILEVETLGGAKRDDTHNAHAYAEAQRLREKAVAMARAGKTRDEIADATNRCLEWVHQTLRAVRRPDGSREFPTTARER